MITGKKLLNLKSVRVKITERKSYFHKSIKKKNANFVDLAWKKNQKFPQTNMNKCRFLSFEC